MAICTYCSREMASPATYSCVGADLVIDMKPRRPLRYKMLEGYRCHDCNICPGGYHHPGCDMEQCPRCGGQAISCGCVVAEEDGEGQ